MYLVIYTTLNQNSVIFTQLKPAFSNSQQFYQLNWVCWVFTQLKPHTTKQKPPNSAIFTATKVTTARTQIKPHTTKPNNSIRTQNSSGRVVVGGATPAVPVRYYLCSSLSSSAVLVIRCGYGGGIGEKSFGRDNFQIEGKSKLKGVRIS